MSKTACEQNIIDDKHEILCTCIKAILATWSKRKTIP